VQDVDLSLSQFSGNLTGPGGAQYTSSPVAWLLITLGVTCRIERRKKKEMLRQNSQGLRYSFEFTFTTLVKSSSPHHEPQILLSSLSGRLLQCLQLLFSKNSCIHFKCGNSGTETPSNWLYQSVRTQILTHADLPSCLQVFPSLDFNIPTSE